MPSQTTAPTLPASLRSLTGKQVRQLRNQGQVPAVVYGHKREAVSLSVDEREFAKLYREVGSTTLINLAIADQKPVKVLVHEIQSNRNRSLVTHVDFYIVNLKEKLRTSVPLSFIGVTDAIDVEGGTLMTVRDEVEVECLPDALIQHIDVDIALLKTFDDSIRVSDLHVPEGVVILDDAEEMIASVAAPRSQEEMDELEAPVDASIDHVEIETTEGTTAAAETDKEKGE